MSEKSLPTPDRPPADRPRPIRNVLSNWTVFVFSTVTNFFVAPFIVHSLGDTAYGAWVLLGTLVGYLGLLDLGVRGAVTRYVARLHAVADHEEAGRFASAGLFIFGITAAIALTAGLGMAAGLDRFFDIPPDLLSEARIAVILIAGTIALALLGGVYGGVVTALQRFELASATEIGVEAVRVAAVVVALRAGQGLLALAAIHLGCGIIRFTAYFVLSRRVYPEMRVARGQWTRTQLREVFSFSLASVALQGASTIILQLDAIVIGAFLPIAMVTYFAIAATLTRYGRAVISGISYTVPPRVSAQQGRGDLDGTRRTALLGGRLAGLVHMPIVAILLLRGGTFIGLWMGPEYGALSGRVLQILAVASWFIAGRHIVTTALMGLNRHRTLVPAMWVEAILNLGLSVVLVRSMGITGVAIGTTLPSLLMTMLVYPRLFSRVLGVRPSTIATELWLRPSLAVLPFALASLVLERFTTPGSLVVFIAQVAILLPLAAASAWWIGLARPERREFALRAPPWLRTFAIPGRERTSAASR